MHATVRPRRARTETDVTAQPNGWVLASDPRALSDSTAFILLVLALAGTIGLIVLAVVGVVQQLI